MTDQRIDPKAPVSGIYGRADFCPPPSAEQLATASAAARAANEHTVATYLLNAPMYHPAWGQYVMSIIDLKPDPRFADATLYLPEATHELVLFAIDPEHSLDVDAVTRYCVTGDLPILRPVNIGQQFTATDEEMHQVGWFACRGVVTGRLFPETGDAPTAIRAMWQAACNHVLDHLRGTAHECPGALAPAVTTCRGCGCTDDHACPGGCSWVEPDLCSACYSGRNTPTANPATEN